MTEPPIQADRGPLAAAELTDVLVQSFSASLLRLASVESLTLEIGTSWAKKDGGLLCKFTAKCLLYDTDPDEQDDSTEEDHLLARLGCEIVCEYGVNKAHREQLSNLEKPAIKAFAQEVALPAAFPYIREAMSSMSTRLGFPRVTLGTLHPGSGLTFSSKTL
ncbi:hypothetical protein ACTMS0_22875 [Micromonospora sp. H33]|uniref:hypothetical protein n=1 Tax=Micromonospora sp. H33 TaxID=3452215 RepID=UPI003F88E91E